MSVRGKLRVYLGAAPGVGKTYHMLDEAKRRAERGADVVVALVETHNRPYTAAMLQGLEMVPRARLEHRGTEFEEMDVDAVLARRPGIAIVDELAHTNVPGSRNAKRWQDVDELLDAGIEVITNLNVQHLESLNDVVQKITGVPQRETVPDAMVRSADQIELIDMAPEALRRRMAHGNVYAPEKIDAALSNYFRVGNLSALRELALLWLAGRVDEGMTQYKEQHGIGGVWETRERVVVALTGGPEGATLIRRAARIAQRVGGQGGRGNGQKGSAGSDLLAVHVARSDGLTGASPAALAEQRELVESLGGTFHSVVGDDVPTALLQFARAENATQLVLGVSRRGRITRFLSGYGIGEIVTRDSGDIDVHMVTHEKSAADSSRWAPVAKALRLPESDRRWLRPLAAVGWPILTTLVLVNLRTSVNNTSQVLIYLAVVVLSARLGGLVSALLTSVTASLLLNYFFIAPYYRLTIAQGDNIVALVVFVLVALIVASVVDLSARQSRRAANASAEAETLSQLAVSVLRGDEAIGALLSRFRETFGMDSVTMLERIDPEAASRPDEQDDPSAWRLVAASGGAASALPCRMPGEADITVKAGPDAVLALRGRALPASDQRVLTAFAAQAAVALDRSRLALQAAEAAPLAAADKMRTALLAAVSHDLRTPLAAAKISVASLRDTSVDWSPEDRADLLAGAEESLDRLTRLVENLLDMSRLQAGALNLHLEPTALEDVISVALDSLAADRSAVRFGDFDAAADVLADPVLLERVIANLVGNALNHGSTVRPVLLTASALAGRVELRVVDRGPGISPQNWERVFTAFQRLGDRDNTTGVGLGLALSRGLVEAMAGTLTPEETPGGGLTMVVSLPAADESALADDALGESTLADSMPVQETSAP